VITFELKINSGVIASWF